MMEKGALPCRTEGRKRATCCTTPERGWQQGKDQAFKQALVYKVFQMRSTAFCPPCGLPFSCLPATSVPGGGSTTISRLPRLKAGGPAGTFLRSLRYVGPRTWGKGSEWGGHASRSAAGGVRVRAGRQQGGVP